MSEIALLKRLRNLDDETFRSVQSHRRIQTGQVPTTSVIRRVAEALADILTPQTDICLCGHPIWRHSMTGVCWAREGIGTVPCECQVHQ